MTDEVQVRIKRTPTGFEMVNDRGKSWFFPADGTIYDESLAAALASAVTMMVSATVATVAASTVRYGREIVDFKIGFTVQENQ